ncbi:UrcA family protein [Sphingobium sp. Z007]|uniref:UrcA family protein n=1 Tax=Sphingobium sp. Z007 TaxID=627495 RepID=UPI000B498C8B|nr:UrcA family protein [Sphingobium sp. Z007]
MYNIGKKAIILAALLSSMTGAVAFAGTGERIEVRHDVNIAGLDLTSAHGRTLLDQRIRGAVRAICGRTVGRDLYATMDQRRCTRDAFASTMPQIELAVAKARNERYAGDPAKVAAVTIKR